MTQPVSPEDALKACPFCASPNLDEKTRASTFQGDVTHQGYVECYDCGACGPATAWYNGDHDDAIHWLRKMHNDEGWNTRTDPPKTVLEEEVVALRGLLVECQDRFRYLDQGVWVALIDDELTRLKDRGTD